MFAAVFAAEGSACDRLLEAAREFSPRVEACGAREVTLDVSGLARLFGDGKTIATELHRTAAARGLDVHVAVAGTRTAARLLAHHSANRKGPHRHAVTVIDPGTEAVSLASLPIELLADLEAAEPGTPGSPIPDPRSRLSDSGSRIPDPGSRELRTSDPRSPIPDPFTITLRRWGLRTLGELASLPPDDVAARLGQAGVEWQRLARGEDRRPLVPAVPEERFEQALDLEWPIEGLEPLSFVLGRLLDPISAHLERRDRGAAILHVRLHLVTREVHERSLQLPAPIRDARTLRTLALLDLESHPPSAAIDRVVVAIDPTPGRVVQFSLLTRPLPSPEQLSTLMARLNALMGEGRCGAAIAVDSWEPGAFSIQPFAPTDSTPPDRPQKHRPDGPQRSDGPQRHRDTENSNSNDPGSRIPDPGPPIPSTFPIVALRRFRFPVPARVQVNRGVPVRVICDRHGWNGGRVETYAGPWRSSGGWWVEAPGLRVSVSPWPVQANAWERDEWDVTLGDAATYRLFRERATDAWFIEGVVD